MTTKQLEPKKPLPALWSHDQQILVDYLGTPAAIPGLSSSWKAADSGDIDFLKMKSSLGNRPILWVLVSDLWFLCHCCDRIRQWTKTYENIVETLLLEEFPIAIGEPSCLNHPHPCYQMARFFVNPYSNHDNQTGLQSFMTLSNSILCRAFKLNTLLCYCYHQPLMIVIH